MKLYENLTQEQRLKMVGEILARGIYRVVRDQQKKERENKQDQTTKED